MELTTFIAFGIQVVFYTFFRYHLVAETLYEDVMWVDKVGDLFYATQQVYEVVCCCRYARNALHFNWRCTRNKDR